MWCIKSETICTGICVLQFSYAHSYGYIGINSLAGELSFVLGVQYYIYMHVHKHCMHV